MSRRKNNKRRRLRNRTAETVIIIQETIRAEDTLFPEKLARANEIMKNVKLPDELL